MKTVVTPTGEFSRDASVAFYSTMTPQAGEPPIGSRDFAFIVGVYEDVVAACPVVGRDPLYDGEDGWPPPYRVTDPITDRISIYERGETRPVEGEDTESLEPAAVWDLQHVVERLTGLSL